MAAAARQPVSAQVVGNAFVQQYYPILHHSPALVHKFYQNPSKLGRPEEDGSMSITTTKDAINEKMLSLNYGELKAEIKSVDAQESFNAGVTVLVTGYLTGKDNSIRNFTQSFFLAPQKKGYYVLNDMFRYIENASLDAANEVLVSDVVHVDAPVTPEEEPSPSQESVISEQTIVLAEEVNGEDADKPSDNGEVPVVEEEVPVAEVVEEVQDKASPITIGGGRQAVIEEKRSTNTRGKHGVPSLRETAVMDSPVVRTLATLTLFPPTALGPPAPSPGVDALSSRPPLVPTCEGGGFTSTAAPAGTVPPLVDLPPFPQDILYAGVGLRRYTVPELPLSDNTFSYLGGRVGDEMVTVRAVDLRAWHARSLYNWNLLQFVGRDPTSYMDDYRRVVEVSLRTDDPVVSQMRSESRRSSSQVSRRSRSSVIRPMASARTAEIFPTVPAAEVTRLVADPAPTVHPPGGGLRR